MMRLGHRRTVVGFTLSELLVVIAIIALLVSILVPSLARAKEMARIVICANNLHALALGIHLYADDTGGLLPGPSGYRGNCLHYFYENAGDPYNLYPAYVSEPASFYCPSGAIQHDMPINSSGAGSDETFFHWLSYGTWARIVSYDCYASVLPYPGIYESIPTRVEDPASWVIWTDMSAWFEPLEAHWQSNHPGNYGGFPETPPTFDYRMGINVATMDGAVNWRWEEETKSQYPAFGVAGWWSRF